jgi:mono/diheme cytochrome c family protein
MVRGGAVRRCALVALWAALAASSATSQAIADDTQPRFDFLLNCAGCHRMDASGSATVPPLTGLAPLIATPDGRAYLVRVPGVAQAPLSDERLAMLLNWALAEFSGAHGFAPYSAGEVAPLRADPLRDPLSERERMKRGLSPFPH